MHADKRKNFGRTLTGVAATGVVVATLIVAPPVGPASAADEVKNCSGRTGHHPFSPDRSRVRQDLPVRSGPYGGCTKRWEGPAAVDLHCWVINDFNNVFWFVENRNTGKQGWVYEENLTPSPGNSYMCGEHVLSYEEWKLI